MYSIGSYTCTLSSVTEIARSSSGQLCNNDIIGTVDSKGYVSLGPPFKELALGNDQYSKVIHKGRFAGLGVSCLLHIISTLF